MTRPTSLLLLSILCLLASAALALLVASGVTDAVSGWWAAVRALAGARCW
jgi:hypothetical protein